MPKRRPVVEIHDGEWVTIEWVGQHEECCGCGLRHITDYRVKAGKLQFRAVRQKRKRRGRR